MDATDVRHLRRAIELARLARAHGNHPFGSLLVSGAGEVLAEHEIVFALGAERFRALLPAGAPYLALGTRELFARGNRRIEVEGPCAELEADAIAVHDGFWR
jgi:hypothetical protein